MTWLETASKITPSSKMASTPKRTKVPLIPHIDSHPMLFTEDLEKSWVDVYTPGYGSSIDEIPIRVRECKQLEKLSQEHSSRAFFLRQKNSNSRLLISRNLYDALVETNDIFDEFQDFVLSFGWKEREYDIGPPACRFNTQRTVSHDNTLHFECAYGLRYVEPNDYGGGKSPWSVRQTAIYCNLEDGVETWVFISASKAFETEANRHLSNTEREPSLESKEIVNPFDLHATLIEVAIVNWRWYIKYLVESSTEQSNRVIGATVGKGKLSTVIDFEINFEDRQILKSVEDKALDLLAILDSTSDTVSAILTEYAYLPRDGDDVKPDRTTMSLRNSLRKIQLYKSKTETLCKRISGTASLLSDLLDYENAKIAQGNGESLTILAQESREENSTMRILTEKGTKDAAAVKVITLITIVYLPTTVVSGFFSTQFVRTDGSNLTLTDNWWIIVAISFPLTMVTFTVWYFWIRFPWQKWWDERRHLWPKNKSSCILVETRIQNTEEHPSLGESPYRKSLSGSSSLFVSPQYRKSLGIGCWA